MSGLFLSFLAAVLATFGGRDLDLVAALSRRLGRGVPVLAAAWLAAAGSSALAAGAGSLMAPLLPAGAKAVLVAFALILAALETGWRMARRKAPKEPTRSFFAVLIVMFAHQIGDSARFLIFAVAAATAAPEMAAIGGTLGNGAILTGGWMGYGFATTRALRLARMLCLPVFLIVAVLIVLLQRGLI